MNIGSGSDYLHKLEVAVSHHKAGEFESARALYNELLVEKADDPAVFHLLGLLCAQSGNVTQGIDFVSKAIDANSGEYLLHLHHAKLLLAVGQWKPAVRAADMAVALAPDRPTVYLAKAQALNAGGLYTQALVVLEVAISMEVDVPQVLACMGDTLQALNQTASALAHYDAALQRQPECLEAHTGKGLTLLAVGRWAEAIRCFDQLVARAPSQSAHFFHRAVASQALHQWDAAIQDYGQAIALQADLVQAYCNRGNVYQSLGQFACALKDYEGALQYRSDCAQALYNKSLLLLLWGDFEHAWPLYELRWQKDEMRTKRFDCLQPQWTGVQSLAGRVVILHCEQGLGDSIQFVRFAPMMCTLGAEVIIRAPRTLLALFGSLRADIRYLSMDEPLPDFDYHCPLMSLPLAFRTQLSTIPASSGYLAAAPDRLRKWQQLVGAKRSKRVGIVCSGSASHPDDLQRSIPLEMLLKALPLQFEYYSLQNELQPKDHAFMKSQDRVQFYGAQL
jgi:tetratricopeptide (TPR) repeat protein